MEKNIYKKATSNEELHQILALQSINLPTLISEEIKIGFLFI